MKGSTYNLDKKLEHEVHNFLMKYRVYEQLFKDFPNTVTDPRLQKLGADVTVGNLVIDEKAMVAWAGANSRRRNFAAEYINFASGNIGWIARSDMITTHYLQVFIYLKNFYTNKDSRTNRMFKCDDILALDILLIDKKKFKDRVSKIISDEDIMKEFKNMYSNKVSYRVKNGIELRISYILHEKPAFITISSDKLESIGVANKYYVYHGDGTVYDGYYVGDVEHEPSQSISD